MGTWLAQDSQPRGGCQSPRHEGLIRLTPYQVDFTPRARKEPDAQEHVTRGRILKALARLATDPSRSPNAKALEGGGFRLQVGDFRTLYIIEHARVVVVVVGVRDRKEAYR